MLEYVRRVGHAHAHHAPPGNHPHQFLQQRGQVRPDVPAVRARVLRGDPQLHHPFAETVPGPLHDLVDGVGGERAARVPRLAVSALVQAPAGFVLGDFQKLCSLLLRTCCNYLNWYQQGKHVFSLLIYLTTV